MNKQKNNRFCADKAIADTKVVVAMSGGVDSSVVASLLHDEGYDVIGVTMQLYDQGMALAKKGACCAGQDIYDAKQVAEQRGFPHYVLDYETAFRQEVMEEFADSYVRGETPVPCIRCNQSVKFRDLLTMAKSLNADALATGHYVRRVEGKEGPELHKAIDEQKDQSYFLAHTTQKQLNYLHFPLGGLRKEETRQLAEHYGLEVADKPDSQDICFVVNGSYRDVVARLRPEAIAPGDIIDLDGKVLGQHDGVAGYTRGQRRGLGIATGEPVYVIKVDAEKRHVVVGPESALYDDQFAVKELNWLGHEGLLDAKHEVTIKLRSAHKPVGALLKRQSEDGVDVSLLSPERAITRGQACVMYDGTRVLGAGWIV